MSVIERVQPRRDIYAEVTQRIIDQLVAGVVPWAQPWTGGGLPKNVRSNKAYRGINVFLLGMSGYESPWWGTYRQWDEKGAQVRKGEHATTICFWKRIDKNTTADEKAAGMGDRKRIIVLRYFRVFSAEQVDDLPERYTLPGDGEHEDELDVITHAEQIMAGYVDDRGGPPITYRGGSAFYTPSSDRITLPPRKRFVSPHDFYSTAFHELVHSTGHKKRLDREGFREIGTFGSPTYSREELVAEMGAAFLAGVAGIDLLTVPQNAAYVGHWLGVLRGDSKLVVQAAGAAQRAADHILGTEFEPESDTNEGENA